MYTRRWAVITLVVLLSAAVDAKPVPIGTVSSCKAATIHGTNLVPGTTIFSGDTIHVGAQGSVWIAVEGGGQVQVSENSTVVLTKSPDSIRVTGDRGQAQTNSKGVVINSVSLGDIRSQVGPKVDLDKHKDTDRDKDRNKDRDCEVSKDSRRIRPCRDDID